jgi:Cof subfamily protein (haloacid dehalogenase superfamily)
LYKGAVFFDMDGTIIDARHGIEEPTEKTVQTIKQLEKNGFLVGLATGRSKCYISPCAGLFNCYVTSNGAHAEVANTVISECIVQPDELAKLTSYLDDAGLNYVLEGQRMCYCKDIKEIYYLDMMNNYNFSDKYFFPLKDIQAIPVNKLMVTYDKPEKIEQFKRAYGSLYDITLQPGNQACDVGMKGISKGYGVKQVIDYFQLDPKNTYAFGDADNDYDMLCTVGNGIAMGIHSEKLELAACYITGSVQEDGIYQAAKQYGLI